jgi:hypothetical protein
MWPWFNGVSERVGDDEDVGEPNQGERRRDKVPASSHTYCEEQQGLCISSEGWHSSYSKIPPLIHAGNGLMSKVIKAVVLTSILPTSIPNRTGKCVMVTHQIPDPVHCCLTSVSKVWPRAKFVSSNGNFNGFGLSGSFSCTFCAPGYSTAQRKPNTHPNAN